MTEQSNGVPEPGKKSGLCQTVPLIRTGTREYSSWPGACSNSRPNTFEQTISTRLKDASCRAAADHTFFLDVDDDMRLAQLLSQPRILALQFQIFFLQWITPGLRPAFLWSQRFENAVGPFTPPGCQQRRVQTFTAQESSEAASRSSGGFGFLQD